MFFLGDVHGEIKPYEYVITHMLLKGGVEGMDCSIQLGDMGIGFRNKKALDELPVFQNHKFIRGNHDNPEECKTHPQYLGDFGFDKGTGIFFVSGGFSIDWQYRQPDWNWWKNEELTQTQMKTALKLYKETKPKVVASHEGPLSVKKLVITNEWKMEHDSNTEKLLQNMLDIHRPDFWIFGHHHNRKEFKIQETQFVCLQEFTTQAYRDCYYEIPEIKWSK